MNHTDRKAEIIDASITLFCEKGLDLTSMQDIAAATGISKATLYFYFDSKAALIQEVYQHCYQMDVKACNQDVDQEKTAMDKLCKRFQNIIDYSMSHPRESMIERLYTASPVYCDMFLQCKKEFYNDIEKIITEGRKTGEFKESPLWLMTTAYYGFASQIYLKLKEEPSLWNDDTLHACMEMIRGMFAKADTEDFKQ
ncbi:MAG: TetR/AcrR family transcriptional regulator [Lachnospiraceae bacterium]|nr:TetR/AcrR family transcriptional regulator [Lachnospiraceae bacterium]